MDSCHGECHVRLPSLSICILLRVTGKHTDVVSVSEYVEDINILNIQYYINEEGDLKVVQCQITCHPLQLHLD